MLKIQLLSKFVASAHLFYGAKSFWCEEFVPPHHAPGFGRVVRPACEDEHLVFPAEAAVEAIARCDFGILD